MIAGAIILAAGGATRFGGRKQLLEIKGVTLLARACLTADAAGFSPIVRVLGAGADEILQREHSIKLPTLIYQHWQNGIGSSLAAGVSHLLTLEPECEAILILLADQPLVSRELLEHMLESLQPPFSMVLCDYGNGSGPPALFQRSHFSELLALTGDRGAKALTAKHPNEVKWLSFPDGSCDIDSKDQWSDFEKTLTDL